MKSYLQDLTLRLAEGEALLPEELRRRHAAWILSQQQTDGGFGGREGGSDLYYTSFALRSLFLLGDLYGPVAERSGDFLKSRLGGRESIVDLVSLVYSAVLLNLSADVHVMEDYADGWQDEIVAVFERLRRKDGGYAKAEEGVASSTYHSFLILICLQLLERPVLHPDQVVGFLLSQRSDQGGFHEIRAAKRPGTNPTAAAVGGLQILGTLDSDIRRDTIEFLGEMQTDEGGLRAEYADSYRRPAEHVYRGLDPRRPGRAGRSGLAFAGTLRAFVGAPGGWVPRSDLGSGM